MCVPRNPTAGIEGDGELSGPMQLVSDRTKEFVALGYVDLLDVNWEDWPVPTETAGETVVQWLSPPCVTQHKSGRLDVE